MSFVTCKLSGRTGNNCFQIMTTIAHALKHGAEYKIPSFTKSKYTKNCPFDQFPKLTAEDEARIEFEHYQDGWEYHELPYKPNMRLSGWYQNINYFDAYKKEIIEAFNLPKEKIDAVAVHVRMGDYKRYPTKHPILGDEYYYPGGIKNEISNAQRNENDLRDLIEDYKEQVRNFYNAGLFCKHFQNLIEQAMWDAATPISKKIPHHVFSDDEAARETYKGAEEYFINGDPMEDWIRMTQYKYFIIANSTYSWTAAYLSGSDYVIAPHEVRWYGESNKHIYTGDLIPKQWIKI